MDLRNSWLSFPVCLLLCTLGNIFITEVSSGKILFILPIATKSHMNLFDPLISQLGRNGHEIFVMSSVSLSEKQDNIEEFMPVSLKDIFTDMENVFEQRKKSGLSRLSMNTDFLTNACHKIFQHPKTKELLKTKQNYYDLIVLDTMGNNCVYGMITHLQSPVISFVTFPPQGSIVATMGTNFPNSFIPDPFLPLTHRMTFPQRVLNNLFQYLFPYVLGSFLRDQEAVYRHHLGAHMPSNAEVMANFSLLLTNTHFIMNYPRPLLPDIIEVGGIHCKPAKPLPKDLEEFLGGAADGFIFFSFGSVVKSKDMPQEHRKAFIKVFSSLKQKVLWKWDEDMDDLPENVKLTKWAPQQDILGHKNIKLFISHGGLLSSQEAVYHGVPVLNIPFFGDQDLNSNSNVQAGFALSLEIIDLTEELLQTTMKELLEDPKYYKRAKELSAIFRDQPQSPLDRAVYWTEYVMKFKGAPHLRSSARDLSFIQYHSLDVIAFLLVSILTVLCVAVYSIRKLIRCCLNIFTSSNQNTSASKKLN